MNAKWATYLVDIDIPNTIFFRGEFSVQIFQGFAILFFNPKTLFRTDKRSEFATSKGGNQSI